MTSKKIIFILFFLPSFLIAQSHDQLDKFVEIYLTWDASHPDLECEMVPELEAINSVQTLWRIQNSDGSFDMILGVVSDIPIPHESYIFLTEEGDYVMYFPETNRTVLLCLKEDLPLPVGYGASGFGSFLASLEFIKPFVTFEELKENDDSITLELILDGNKMLSEGVIPIGAEVEGIRLILTSAKDGQPLKTLRQFDNDDMEVLCFSYLSFSSDEVRASFPEIENRSSSSITPDFTIRDALEEIYRNRNS